jgi:LRR receptor-like serine/threonine-protein kinase FLS2
MVDVVLALNYFHQGHSESVVHCDLKPTNILLEEDMAVHVGDFGITKILAKNKDATQIKTLGILGYVHSTRYMNLPLLILLLRGYLINI